MGFISIGIDKTKNKKYYRIGVVNESGAGKKRISHLHILGLV